VPTSVCFCKGGSEDSRGECAVPKSARYAGPSRDGRRMLEGLMSRWIMERVWRWERAEKRECRMRRWVLGERDLCKRVERS
jgi:hypothetical protein